MFSYYFKNTSQAMMSIFIHPTAYLTSMIKTIFTNINEYVQRAFSDFGFSDTQVHAGVIYSFITLIILNTLFIDKQEKPFDLKEKSMFIFIILTVFWLTLTANYIIFVLSPNGLIEGFKGRYLIPVLPLFFMLFDNKKFKPLAINLPVICSIYAFFFLLIFTLTLINRYYI